jgi:DNA-binding NtrC family response regulator
MARLLIVDDERNIHVRLASFFEGCGHVVQTAESGKEALELLFRNEPADLVLTDYRMAELNGVELLQQIKRQAPEHHYHPDDSVWHYRKRSNSDEGRRLRLPGEAFLTRTSTACGGAGTGTKRLRAENRTLRDTVEERPLLESKSTAMRRLLDTARQAARSEATILLTGESGTGKNVLARQMHHWSPRREHSFVVVNCTTLSEHLLESELFGTCAAPLRRHQGQAGPP